MKTFDEWKDGDELVLESAGSKLASISKAQKENTVPYINKNYDGEEKAELMKIYNAWKAGGKKGTLAKFAMDYGK